MPRPNLLLFMPDQLRADAVGAFGNPVVQTPSIDALADPSFLQEYVETKTAYFVAENVKRHRRSRFQ